MSKQTEAQLCADALSRGLAMIRKDKRAAAELLRQEALIAELTDVTTRLVDACLSGRPDLIAKHTARASAALAKVQQ